MEWLLVLLAVGLIAANGLFVAAEFALVTVDRATVERDAEAGDARSASVLSALRTLSTQLSGAQLGITVTSLMVGFIAEPSIAALLRGPLGLTGLSETAAVSLSLTLALFVATVFQMVFGELVPKDWAIAEPLRVGRVVVGFQRGFTRFAGPLIRFLNGSANRILRVFGIEATEELASARSPQELLSLVARSEAQGTLSTGTAELVTRSLEFGELTAADVMTPRPRVRFLQAEEPVRAVIAASAGSGHSRFPVTGDGVDDVVGLVHFKHALTVPDADRDRVTVREVMHAAVAVPSSLELDPLLLRLREHGLQMAVVVDEYGGTDGVITLEDLIEEIVGEIDDEQDRPAEYQRKVGERSWVLSGLLRPDEVSDLLGVPVPDDEDYDTLGGLMTDRIGRIPRRGDCTEVDVTHRGIDEEGLPLPPVRLALSVERMDGYRVDRVHVSVTDLAGAGESR